MLHLRMKKLPCRLSSAALAAFIFITAALAGAPFSRTEAYAADKDKTNTTLRPGKPTAPTNAGEDTWNGSKVYYGKYNGQPVLYRMLAFKNALPLGWTEAFTFNMSINDKTEYTIKDGIMVVYIPVQYLKSGRTFAVMGLGKGGKSHIYQDTDTDPATITVPLSLEGYAFDLIYKD